MFKANAPLKSRKHDLNGAFAFFLQICRSEIQFRLAEEVSALGYEQGFEDVTSLLIEIDTEYDSYIYSRKPEEILFDS